MEEAEEVEEVGQWVKVWLLFYCDFLSVLQAEKESH